MNQIAEAPTIKAVTNSELRTSLECCLKEFFGTNIRIIKLDRQISDYRSSFNLEELTVQLDNGESLSVMFKDLSFDNLLESGKRAKPEFLYKPEREIAIYQQVLPPERLGTAACYGSVVDREAGRYWLFLEKISGVELYQVGDLEIWKAAARWLAEFHANYADKISRLSGNPHFLRYNAQLYREWMRRARNFLGKDETSVPKEAREQLKWLAERYERVIEQLCKMPQTFLHGEFYASNVIVKTHSDVEIRVCPIDWEMAGVGPCLIDLAALTAGGWDEEKKAELALAYYRALPQKNTWFPNEETFQNALQYCCLYLAVQWVGWFGRRKPFAAHAQDWLGEAVRLAKLLGL